MEIRNRNIFWESLILAVFIFALGILLGYFLEMNRTKDIITLYQQSELDMLDVKIQESAFSLEDIDCNYSLIENVNFADRIYNEAKLLEDYEDSSKLSEGIMLQHKKYDLLRTLLWINTLKLKEQCPNNIKTIVYFYEYKPENLDIKSQQLIFSRKLEELKNNLGNEIILIPIAGNLDLNSINYMKSVYNIKSLPVVLIDEKVQLSSIEEINDLAEYLDK